MLSDLTCSSPLQLKFWNDKDWNNNNFKTFVADNLEKCMDFCLGDNRCKAFTFDRQNQLAGANCWLKKTGENFKDHSGHTSGVRCNHENTPQFPPSGKYPVTGLPK